MTPPSVRLFFCEDFRHCDGCIITRILLAILIHHVPSIGMESPTATGNALVGHNVWHKEHIGIQSPNGKNLSIAGTSRQ